MLSIFGLFTLKKVTGEDSKKIVLKSPKWLNALFCFLIFLKIIYFIYWCFHITSSDALNLLFNLPRIFVPSAVGSVSTPLNLLMLVVLMALLLDVFMIWHVNTTIIIHKNSKTIYQKGIKQTKKFGLNGPFYIRVNKGFYPHFQMIRKIRPREKGMFSSDINLWSERELFSFSQKNPEYYCLLEFLKDCGLEIINID